MKVSKLFKHTLISQAVGGSLDRENCQIVNRTKHENSVALHLKRESDEEEGRTYLRVKDEFEAISTQLLDWAFTSANILDLTLKQIDDLETNLNIERLQGRIQLSR